MKIGVAQGLFLRALRICKNDCYLKKEFDHIFDSLMALAYPEHILKLALKKARVTHFRDNKKEKLNLDYKNCIMVPYAPILDNVIPVLRSFDKKLLYKYPNKLAKQLSRNKLSTSKLEAGVYKVSCSNCNKFYIGETGRSLKTRLREHRNDIKNNKSASGIVNHVNEMDHEFDFDNAAIIFPSSNVSKRHIVESSIINKNKQNCVNLNSGFVNLNESMSNSVCSLLRLHNIS